MENLEQLVTYSPKASITHNHSYRFWKKKSFITTRTIAP